MNKCKFFSPNSDEMLLSELTDYMYESMTTDSYYVPDVNVWVKKQKGGLQVRSHG